jgi:general secretion pathway protein G
MYASAKRGFTLVEILIVVIILGILAAIVIPQFTNASQDARRSSLGSQLQTIRSQIELYKLQHGDALPALTAAGDWSALTVASGGYGPYMQATPTNPLNGLSTITIGTAGTATAVGFIYDYGTAAAPGSGKIWGYDSSASGSTPAYCFKD